MSRALTISFDSSSNDDIPTMVIATESFGLYGNRMEVLNIITGDRARELYNELSRPKKVCIKAGDKDD